MFWLDNFLALNRQQFNTLLSLLQLELFPAVNCCFLEAEMYVKVHASFNLFKPAKSDETGV